MSEWTDSSFSPRLTGAALVSTPLGMRVVFFCFALFYFFLVATVVTTIMTVLREDMNSLNKTE